MQAGVVGGQQTPNLANDPHADPKLIECLRIIASGMYDGETGVEQPKRNKPKSAGILKKKKNPCYFIGRDKLRIN